MHALKWPINSARIVQWYVVLPDLPVGPSVLDTLREHYVRFLLELHAHQRTRQIAIALAVIWVVLHIPREGFPSFRPLVCLQRGATQCVPRGGGERVQGHRGFEVVDHFVELLLRVRQFR